MTLDSNKKDLVEVLEFVTRLLEILVEQVPPAHRRQFQRVWKDEIKQTLTSTISLINDSPWNSPNLEKLKPLGWTGEQARLKSDAMATFAAKGTVGKVLKLSNSFLGSLGMAFLALESVKEFKDCLEVFLPSILEPFTPITTLFGQGPIPGPNQSQG